MKLGPPSCLLLVAIAVAPAVQARQSMTEWGNELFRDGQTLVTAPLRWQQPQWLRAGGLVVISGALMATADQEVADYHARHRAGGGNDVMQGVSDVLSPLALAGYAGLVWGAGQLLPNDELSHHGFKMGEAVVYATLITGGIKVVVGRARPSSGADVGAFSPWSWRDAHQSFPSAHAAAAFAAARVLSPHLTPGQRVASYGAATLVSYSRLYQGDHWLSDVVFGAGLGYAVGAVLADDQGRKDAQHNGWSITPVHGGIGVSWLQTW
jgi:membrane-associated phospholipid phosphatase